MAIDLTTYADADLDALRVQVLTEQERRAFLAQAPAAAQQLNDRFADAVKDAPPVAASALPDAIGPGVKITWADGQTWQNVSGAWLPKTATPATYPLGWRQLTGLPANVAAWKAGTAYKLGDLASYEGKTYRAIQGHTAQAGWEPPAVASLWALA